MVINLFEDWTSIVRVRSREYRLWFHTDELTLPLCLPTMMDTSARHFLTGSNYHNMSIQTLIDPTHSSYEKPQLL